MAMLEHAASMLEMAHRDHDALVATVDLPQVADSIYGLHAQQAVEKALRPSLRCAASSIHSHTTCPGCSRYCGRAAPMLTPFKSSTASPPTRFRPVMKPVIPTRKRRSIVLPSSLKWKPC